MSRKNKVLTCIQILIVLCILPCNSGRAVNLPIKTGEFPCEGHQCGCKSVLDCKAHCCCSSYKNHNDLKNSNKKQSGFRVFISSIDCKYGSDPLTNIAFTDKYILENQIQLIQGSFLCFLFYNISIYLPEIIASSPEKPPRYLRQVTA
ncbi:MAG: hypothetical protein L3J17_00805 [Candidatus Jettenia sp.]|nr:MAG: hypothetical protein L3J17_00805 [Candidatus Jettenia sp.]